MIISALLVKNPRETRLCEACNKAILGRCIRLYGCMDGGRREHKWTIYQHYDCCNHSLQTLAEQTLVDRNARRRKPKQLFIDFTAPVPF